jgi:hypothetical protein
MKIYGTWEFLYVEITEVKTQIVADHHSLWYLAKKVVQSSRMLINDKRITYSNLYLFHISTVNNKKFKL